MKGKHKNLGRTVPHRVRCYIYVHAHVYVSNLRKLPALLPRSDNTSWHFSFSSLAQEKYSQVYCFPFHLDLSAAAAKFIYHLVQCVHNHTSPEESNAHVTFQSGKTRVQAEFGTHHHVRVYIVEQVSVVPWNSPERAEQRTFMDRLTTSHTLFMSSQNL